MTVERELWKWLEVAKRSGRRGWVLIKEGKIVGVFEERKDAIMAAKEPGLYLLTFVE
ncbi:hypothetical protein [Pyrobaculum aerophilum]|uniref:DUF5678 domain-containing protein n=2 Tax=Pyrobaculum aerophilum TaxID=13773 RepID=Q8ZVF4_PYRAE|nr:MULTISPECIES: hypothetical protein [Pyrobaculum]AAL64102.1 hypothetical protein PAE2311 [Pyrobaculum aerophilum str. IM2]MCX8135851.1 hypothetical protein [Pyrobaculum aerophilum]HII47134.1 hypothetical protein [Pyrobaculum aerophilum]